MPRPNDVGVGVAVVIHRFTSQYGCEFLLGMRKGAHGEGYYAFPGGWIEPGETPAMAAIREVKEEVGLDIIVHPEALLFTGKQHLEGVHVLTAFVEVSGFSGIPENLEPDKCGGWDWYPVHNLPQPLFGAIDDYVNWRWSYDEEQQEEAKD